MTTQQEQPQPQAEPQQPHDLALRVGRLEGLLEMVIEQQRSQAATIDALRADMNARFLRLEGKVDRLLYAVLTGGIALFAAIVGSGFID